MPRPDIKIGEQTFKPIDMGLKEKVALNLAYKFLAGMSYLLNEASRAREINRHVELEAFYGHEAANAYAYSKKPRVRSTTELQMMRQGAWRSFPRHSGLPF